VIGEYERAFYMACSVGMTPAVLSVTHRVRGSALLPLIAATASYLHMHVLVELHQNF
jgi:hypothetical protein